jgi:uncharacterized repeat protein (TIGR03803 family)
LVLGPDGYFWGTTAFGGKHGDGTIFKMSADGSHQPLFSFGRNRPEGAVPQAPLLLASDGTLYGTAGGTLDVSTVFRLDADGHPTVLHTFPPYWAPDGELLEAEDGVLVGTLAGGGGTGYGAIYRLLDRADRPSA